MCASKGSDVALEALVERISRCFGATALRPPGKGRIWTREAQFPSSGHEESKTSVTQNLQTTRVHSPPQSCLPPNRIGQGTTSMQFPCTCRRRTRWGPPTIADRYNTVREWASELMTQEIAAQTAPPSPQVAGHTGRPTSLRSGEPSVHENHDCERDSNAGATPPVRVMHRVNKRRPPIPHVREHHR